MVTNSPGSRADNLGMRAYAWTLPLLLLALALTSPVAFAKRQRVDVRTAKPPISLMPAAGAPKAMDAPVLSGLDYTAIAPPGVRLRVIENEPYIYLQGYEKKGLKQNVEALSRIVLRADLTPTSWYEAHLSLRYHPRKSDDNPLRLSFDTAAHDVYRRAMTTDEIREHNAYGLYEVRSPLGLTDTDDKENRWREYLAYGAALVPPPEGSPEVTPYQYRQGELKVLRRVEARYCLLTINFEAASFPHALTLTENIARCVINQLIPEKKAEKRLTYLAYHPEYEPFIPYFEGEPRDERVADLAERPGEGCGTNPLPITGDVCPLCDGEPPYWPAMPYQDAEYQDQRGELSTDVTCSHCLFPPAVDEDEEKAPPCTACQQDICHPGWIPQRCDAPCGTCCYQSAAVACWPLWITPKDYEVVDPLQIPALVDDTGAALNAMPTAKQAASTGEGESADSS